jgi:type III secretion YscU/HrpY family protein
MGEKTESATPKKLRDARKKGQVAKSQDLPAAFTFMASILITLGMSGTLYYYLSGFLLEAFKLIPKQGLASMLPHIWIESLVVIFLASMPILVSVVAIGLLINFLAVGPCFSVEVFKFDIKKFDPIQNLKGKFKLKTLVELLKSCLKIGIASYLIYGVMYNSLPVLIQSVTLPMGSAALLFYHFLMEVVMKVGLFFLIVAIADFVYQKKNFAKEMKMEKFEVKQEYKNSEGDPHIKGKRRQIAQEIAYSDGPAGGIKQASALVTNPTHLAIAIGYDRELDAAPYIVGMGKDLLAERMIALAKQYKVPVVRNIKLAHKLWEEGEIYEFVPEETYEPLAEILRWVAALETDSSYEYIDHTDLER